MKIVHKYLLFALLVLGISYPQISFADTAIVRPKVESLTPEQKKEYFKNRREEAFRKRPMASRDALAKAMAAQKVSRERLRKARLQQNQK